MPLCEALVVLEKGGGGGLLVHDNGGGLSRHVGWSMGGDCAWKAWEGRIKVEVRP